MELDTAKGQGRGGRGWVFFAVPEEARPFERRWARCPTATGTRQSGWQTPRVIVSGMGQANAERAYHAARRNGESPDWILTSGFAGGLDPTLPTGTLLYDTDEDHPLARSFGPAGAHAGRFHCVERVATTVAEKRQLWESTGAEAVEMESGVLRRLAQTDGIPSATVRIISDAANEPLPLDFNQLMTGDMRMSPWRLTGHLLKSPGTIPELMRFGHRTRRAADRLAEVLVMLSRPL